MLVFFLFKWIIFKSIVWHIRNVFFIFHPVSNYKKCHKFCIMKTNPIKFRSSHEKNVKGSPFRKLANVVLIKHFITILLVFFSFLTSSRILIFIQSFIHDFIQFFLLHYFYTLLCSLNTDDKLTAQRQANGSAIKWNCLRFKWD